VEVLYAEWELPATVAAVVRIVHGIILAFVAVNKMCLLELSTEHETSQQFMAKGWNPLLFQDKSD
jgi:uncharacterized integral membrane protein